MKIIQRSSSVLATEDRHVEVTRALVERLAAEAEAAPLGRIRFNAHPADESAVHEMIIALGATSYVAPHRHSGKSESFHIIRGELDLVFFTVDGEIAGLIAMGEPGSDKVFYHRMAEPAYHTVLPRSPVTVFHETTDGPFVPDATEFAPWAPRHPGAEAEAWLAALDERLRGFSADRRR